MAVSITDRDPNYMRKMWGTSKLITDYDNKKVLKEVMYDVELDYNENDFEYGIEPTYELPRC